MNGGQSSGPLLPVLGMLLEGRGWEIFNPRLGKSAVGSPGLAANGAAAAEKPDIEASSHGQLMSDLLVLLQKQLPWDLVLINNH